MSNKLFHLKLGLKGGKQIYCFDMIKHEIVFRHINSYLNNNNLLVNNKVVTVGAINYLKVVSSSETFEAYRRKKLKAEKRSELRELLIDIVIGITGDPFLFYDPEKKDEAIKNAFFASNENVTYQLIDSCGEYFRSEVKIPLSEAQRDDLKKTLSENRIDSVISILIQECENQGLFYLEKTLISIKGNFKHIRELEIKGIVDRNYLDIETRKVVDSLLKIIL